MDQARYRVDSYPALMMVLHLEDVSGNGVVETLTPQDIAAAVHQSAPGAVWALPVGHLIDSFRIAVLYCQDVRSDHREEVQNKLAALDVNNDHLIVEIITPL